MFDMNLGMATRPLNLPIKKALKTACDLGARGVLLDARNETPSRDLSQSAQREFQHYLRELGLTVSAFHFPTRRPIHDQDALDQRVSAIKQAMHLASQMTTRVLLVDVGALPLSSNTGQDAPEQCDTNQNNAEQNELKLLREVLTDLAQLGNHIGVTITLTPTGGDLAQLKSFLDQIQTGPVGVNLDPATCILNQQDPVELIRVFHDRLTHVVARDASRASDGLGVETALGRGEVCWEEVMAVLMEADYRGWMILQRNMGENRGAEMSFGIRYLQNIGLG